MKRRNFLIYSLGVAGLVGLGATKAFANGAMAHNAAHQYKPMDIAEDLDFVSESSADSFNHNGHQVQILRRVYRHRKSPKVMAERWAMKFNGKELPPSFFSRIEKSGRYFSELLPFDDDQLTARNLAKDLVDGHNMGIYRLVSQ